MHCVPAKAYSFGQWTQAVPPAACGRTLQGRHPFELLRLGVGLTGLVECQSTVSSLNSFVQSGK